ncbi:MAG: aconitase X catalytic domain-containing protein [Promethearchaeota archaeon]
MADRIMDLTKSQQRILDGEDGPGTQIAMEIIVTLGKIYNADKLIPVDSCQISGVSFKNIGDAGLEFIETLKKGGARAKVRATLNPCGLDLVSWRKLGFDEMFFEKQMKVINAYESLGIESNCTCTPYLIGNLPKFGSHVAWAESSAVAYVNSVIGARTNREGGPSALATALTGFTANYNLHLDARRIPNIKIQVTCPVKSYYDFGRLGLLLGAILGKRGEDNVPLICGLNKHSCSTQNLKQLGAAMAASGSVALYHVSEVTPEVIMHPDWTSNDDLFAEVIEIDDLSENGLPFLPENDDGTGRLEAIDLVFFGCPHYSIDEGLHLLELLRMKKIKTKLWIAMARKLQDELHSRVDHDLLLASNARIISDMCIVVAPLNMLGIKTIVTDSGKAYYYLRNNNKLNVYYTTTENCIKAAEKGFVRLDA